MAKNLFFSVVIPTLNEEDCLPELLTDLSNQHNKNFEVIITDGNSEDRTKKVCEEFAAKIPVHYYNAEKRNLSFQRNFGAAKAIGEYLVFFDADVRINAVFLKNLETEILKSKHLIYLPKLIPGGGGDYGDEVLFKLVNFLVEISQNTSKPLPTGSAMVFNRDFFNMIGGYNDKHHDKKVLFPEDQEIVIRAKQRGVKAKVAKKCQFRFSLRRMRKEGKLNVMGKYVLMALEMMLGGKPSSSLAYEMGGQAYKDKPVKKDVTPKAD